MVINQSANNYLDVAHENENLLDCCTSSNNDKMISKVISSGITDDNLINLISKYPIASYKEISSILNNIFGDNLYFFGNGSEDLIVRINIVAKLKKLKVAVLKPLFYRIYTSLDSFKKIGYSDIFNSDLHNIDLCWIVNPNSINDKYLSKNKLIDLIKNNPHTNFIVDETSIFFFDNWKNKSLFSEVNNYSNLTVISSLSKYFGVPGLRFGFGATNSIFFEEIKKISATFPVSSICAYYVVVLLKNLNIFESYRKKIEINKQNLIKILHQNPDIEIKKSVLNFILCKSKSRDLYKGLLSNDLLSFDMNEVDNCYRGWVRLTIHSSDEINSQLIQKLLSYLNSKK